jgi:intein/homing endonuclease
MNTKEQAFLQSIKEKIKDFKINTDIKNLLNDNFAGQILEVQYSNGKIEEVDIGIEYELCRVSPSYFISNYAWIDFPGIGIIPFDLYYFQKQVLSRIESYQKIVIEKVRQCLTKENFVMTDKGYISIKDVKIGDKIETIVDGKSSFVLVKDSFYTGKRKVCTVETISGLKITCTLDHKVFTKRGWIEAGDLTVKDEIASMVRESQSFERIKKIVQKRKKRKVYDITTESSDFLANGLLVHNCGMSTLFSLYCFWRGNFHESESIDVVSLKQLKAQAFVDKMNATMNRIPVFLKTEIVKNNSQVIEWKNNSKIVSESQSENAGRSDSLSLLVLDEAAHYVSERMIRGIVAAAQPTLSRTGGQMVLLSCVISETYVFTDKGIQQVKDFIPKECKPGFNKIQEFKIDGIKHQQKCDTFYDSGETETLEVKTRTGYKIEGTEIHPLLVYENENFIWKQIKDIKLDDFIVVKKQCGCFGNIIDLNFSYTGKRKTEKSLHINRIDKDLSYFIGIFISEGYIDKSKYKITIAVNEEEIYQRIKEFADRYGLSCNFFRKRGKVEINSKALVLFFSSLGIERGTTARTKKIPKVFLQTTKENTQAMLQGMFDGDGCNNEKINRIDYCSFSSELLYQLKMVLILFGIKSTISEKSNSLFIFSEKNKFFKEIGFSLQRKQLRNIIREERAKIVEEKEIFNILYDGEIFYDKVVSIKKGTGHTYDFSIPETSSFAANGIISHNTPNGTASSGAYYYEQVMQARMENDKDTFLVSIDWWEVPDFMLIPGPKKGFNKELKEYALKDYFNNPEIKKEAKKFFDPIAEKDYKNNPWLKKQYEDLGEILYKQEVLHNFIVSGSSVFNEDILDNVSNRIKDPVQKDKLGEASIQGLWIWKHPIPGHRYCIGIDISTGTGDDFTTIEVFDVDEYEQAAEYKGMMSTKMIGRFAKIIARYYNEAFVIIECNSIGEAVFNEVYYHDSDPYINVYKQRKTKNGVTRMTGWTTDVKTRKLITNEFIDWFSVDGLFSQLLVYSKRLYLEMTTWIWDGNKPIHAGGAHDDSIIAFSLVLYLRNESKKAGEGYLIMDDGQLIAYDGSKDKIEDENDDSFGIVMDENDEEDIFQKNYGVSKEDYEWIIK